MSKYTTGEIAKLCGVSVRTVQYYDSRGILIPSELSEGGRRLYSESDLDRMKTICFLREMGLSINTISELLREEDPGAVISLILDQHEAELRVESNALQKKLNMVDDLRRALKINPKFSLESIGDIGNQMENKKKLKRFRVTMIVAAIITEAIEIGSAMLGILEGIWWPFFAIGLPVVIAFSIWFSALYYKRVDYICPKCNKVFKPKFKEVLWANHTPTTRKLRCPECGQKGFCVEVYSEKEQN
ncbi:MAG: MerR family transcriptional regulator [Clostridia bacterium]|nr:MerR family transcriptional regulator [Clostridia bacterium]